MDDVAVHASERSSAELEVENAQLQGLLRARLKEEEALRRVANARRASARA